MKKVLFCKTAPPITGLLKTKQGCRVGDRSSPPPDTPPKIIFNLILVVWTTKGSCGFVIYFKIGNFSFNHSFSLV